MRAFSFVILSFLSLQTATGISIGGSPTVFHNFAQFGDGGGIRTVVLLINQNPFAVTAQLELLADDGSALSLPLDGSTASQFTIELPARATRRLATAGNAEAPSVGWARLSASAPIGAQLLFEIRNGETLLTQAAVESSATQRVVDVFADQTSGSRTGVALANNSEAPALIRLTLIDPDGNPGASADVELPANGHLARFLDEFFNEMGDFSGRVSVNANAPIVVTTLQQTGVVLGTLPPVARLPRLNPDAF